MIDRFDVRKIETMSDAMMCASGIPIRNGDHHVAETSNFCLEMVHTVYATPFSSIISAPLLVRMGFHTGPAMAAVLGTALPKYSIFGDTGELEWHLEGFDMLRKRMCP